MTAERDELRERIAAELFAIFTDDEYADGFNYEGGFDYWGQPAWTREHFRPMADRILALLAPQEAREGEALESMLDELLTMVRQLAVDHPDETNVSYATQLRRRVLAAARPAPETRDDEASWVEYERRKLRYTETLLSRHGVGPWPSATSDDVTAAETALDVHVHAMAAPAPAEATERSES